MTVLGGCPVLLLGSTHVALHLDFAATEFDMRSEPPLLAVHRMVDGELRQPTSNPSSARLQPVAAPDHVEHDLVGAGADAVQAHVAPHALDAVLLM